MTTRIKVAVRIRPFLDFELRQGHQNTKLYVNNQKNEVIIAGDGQNQKSFKFDHVFTQKSNQEDLFKGCNIDHYINKVIEGYHSTVFAYGQTGSGKTYSMEGYDYQQTDKGIKPKLKSSQEKQLGLIPRIVNGLFDKISINSNRIFTISCSFLQIYNEKIYDLLNPASIKSNPGQTDGWSQGGLRLRWTGQDLFQAENLFIFECKSPEEVMNFFKFGIKNRIIAQHKLNLSSSRSHTILTIRIDSIDRDNENPLSSKLELVDLAGSERIGQTGTEGKLAKESIDINKSLFTLRQVISSLADLAKNQKSKDQAHIPYRESKLTSLLKQSIGGNSYCLMLACLQPADVFIDENQSTLIYATKAASIQCEPVQNNDPKTQKIRDLKNEVKKLKTELEKANKHIEFLSQLTQNMGGAISENNSRHLPNNSQKILLQIPNPIEKDIFGQNSQLNQPKEQQLMEQGNQNFQIQLPNQSNQPNSIDYEHFSDRLIESITMVRELLFSNKELREMNDKSKLKAERAEQELMYVQQENQDLREKLSSADLHSQQVTQNTFLLSDNEQDEQNDETFNYSPSRVQVYNQLSNTSPYDIGENYKKMEKNELITQILTLRREKQILEKRVKSFDIDKRTTATIFNSNYKKTTSNQITSNEKSREYNANSQPTSHNNSFYQEAIDLNVQKSVPNNQNILDCVPTNFGRYTFYSNIGTLNSKDNESDNFNPSPKTYQTYYNNPSQILAYQFPKGYQTSGNSFYKPANNNNKIYKQNPYNYDEGISMRREDKYSRSQNINSHHTKYNSLNAISKRKNNHNI